MRQAGKYEIGAELRTQISRLAKFLWAYKLGKTRLSYGPVFIWLEPTNRCNLRCPLCPTGEGLQRKWNDMSLELFREILEKLKKANPLLLTLHLAGEPLLAPNIFEMIRLARAAGFQTTLSTNATLLTEEMSRRLIEAGLQSIRLDFCSSKEKFEEVRRGASWDKVYANIITLLKTKLELKSDIPVVRLKDVSAWGLAPGERNERMGELRKLFEGYSIKGFSTLRIHSWAGSFASKHSQSADDSAQRRPRFNPCSHLWTSLAITSEGLVVPCCRDLQYECVLGDLKTQELDEIWNGEALIKMRRAMVKRDISGIPLCSKCSKVNERLRIAYYAFGYIYMRLDLLITGIRQILRPRKPQRLDD